MSSRRMGSKELLNDAVKLTLSILAPGKGRLELFYTGRSSRRRRRQPRMPTRSLTRNLRRYRFCILLWVLYFPKRLPFSSFYFTYRYPIDVPPPPLYVDIEKDDIIPQVPLLDLFRKFDGVTEQVPFSGHPLDSSVYMTYCRKRGALHTLTRSRRSPVT
jgi:hypothetical protein